RRQPTTLILKIAPHGDSQSFFFFQAEDGIRDYKVTGVQTCALPIFLPRMVRSPSKSQPATAPSSARYRNVGIATCAFCSFRPRRSEERRVGKECRSRRATEEEKKKQSKLKPSILGS